MRLSRVRAVIGVHAGIPPVDRLVKRPSGRKNDLVGSPTELEGLRVMRTTAKRFAIGAVASIVGVPAWPSAVSTRPHSRTGLQTV